MSAYTSGHAQTLNLPCSLALNLGLAKCVDNEDNSIFAKGNREVRKGIIVSCAAIKNNSLFAQEIDIKELQRQFFVEGLIQPLEKSARAKFSLPYTQFTIQGKEISLSCTKS